MDGHANIPPSYYGLNQYQTTNPFGDGRDESFNRATMPPPPSGTSLAPFPPCYQFPPTDQPSQSFMHGSIPSQSMFSQPMLNNSYAGGSRSGLPLSVTSLPPPSFRGCPSATVANKDTIPYMMPPSMARKRGGSDKNIVSGLNSLLARNSQRIYPKPIETPVGVRIQTQSDEDVNVVDVNSNGSNKRRAVNDIAPPSRMWRSVSADSSFNENLSVGGGDEPPPSLPPQGVVSVDVGNDNAYGGGFTPDQLSKIAASEDLKKMAASDPKECKRVLANREAAARSKERKELRQQQLEVKVETLETQIDKLTAELKLEKNERMAANDECVRLRIRLDGGDEQGHSRDDLNKQLTGEVHRLTQEAIREREETSRLREEVSRLREEVSEYRRRESEIMKADDLLEQLMNDPQTNYDFE